MLGLYPCIFVVDMCHSVGQSELWSWSGGRGILIELSLCCSIVYHYNDAQWYEQFWQVGWLDHALILLDLAVFLLNAGTYYIFSLHDAMYILIFYYVLYFTFYWAELGGIGSWPGWLTMALTPDRWNRPWNDL